MEGGGTEKMTTSVELVDMIDTVLIKRVGYFIQSVLETFKQFG